MMRRRVTVLAACLCAMFAVSAVISAVASAEMILPTFSGTAATKGSGTGGKGELKVSSVGIKCENATGEYALEPGSRKLGTFSIDFATCSQGGEPCRSLGDALSTILVTGSWHLVLWLTGANDKHLILALLTQLHIECPTAVVKLLLTLGQVLGSIAAQAGSETKYGLTVKVNAVKGQEYTEYENDAGTGVDVTLETQQEGGKQKPSTEEATENLLTFNGSTKIEN